MGRGRAVRSISGAGQSNPAQEPKEGRIRLSNEERDKNAQLRKEATEKILEILKEKGRDPSAVNYQQAMFEAYDYAEKYPNSATAKWTKLTEDERADKSDIKAAVVLSRGEKEMATFQDAWQNEYKGKKMSGGRK